MTINMRRILGTSSASAVIAAIAALGTPAIAQDNGAEEADDGINASNEIVCRRMPPPSGTRLGSRRICKTQLEWRQLDGETEQIVNDVQRQVPLSSN